MRQILSIADYLIQKHYSYTAEVDSVKESTQISPTHLPSSYLPQHAFPTSTTFYRLQAMQCGRDWEQVGSYNGHYQCRFFC
jgi:hypothetical protein